MDSTFSTSTALLTLFALILTSLLLTLLTDLRTQRRLPPGPIPLPFIGNLPLFRNRKPRDVYKSLSKTYGSLFTIYLDRQPQLIISDPVVASHLLEHHSSVFSSRPRLVIIGELFFRGAAIFPQPYGKQWSLRRKLLTHASKPVVLRGYKQRQDAEASRLIPELADGVEWKKAFARYTASIIFCTAYGRRIDSLESGVVREKERHMKNFLRLAGPGRYWAETFPFLSNIPSFLAPWKKDVERMGDEDAALDRELVEGVRSELENGKAGDCLTKTLLEMDAERTVEPRAFATIPGQLFGAGIDTTMSALSTFLLALLTYPQILSLAQSEIDRVIGPTCSPVLDDEPNLPYITALVKEVLRWRPAAPFGIPHASTER
jgi:cytochrome P450